MTARREGIVYDWLACIVSSDLGPTTRHILKTIASHCNALGESCFPTMEQLAWETGLSKRTIVAHVDIASSLGWLKRRTGKRFSGQVWRNNEYRPAKPDGVEPVAWKDSRRYAELHPNRQHDEFDDAYTSHKAGASDAEAGASDARAGASDAEAGAGGAPQGSIQGSIDYATPHARGSEPDPGQRKELDTPLGWARHLVVVYGYQLHAARTAKTMSMYRRWITDGVTQGHVDEAMSIAIARLGGQPGSPAYLDPIARDVKRESEAPRPAKPERAAGEGRPCRPASGASHAGGGLSDDQLAMRRRAAERMRAMLGDDRASGDPSVIDHGLGAGEIAR